MNPYREIDVCIDELENTEDLDKKMQRLEEALIKLLLPVRKKQGTVSYDKLLKVIDSVGTFRNFI